MSLWYPWTAPWWHFQVSLILSSGLGVHLSSWHWGELTESQNHSFGECCRKLIPGILVSGQVWGSAAGLQELSWQTPALPSAGIDSFPLLPCFVLLAPDFGSCGMGLCFPALVFAAMGDWAEALQVQGRGEGGEANQDLFQIKAFWCWNCLTLSSHIRA